MYNQAVDGMEKHLIHRGADGLTYLADAHWSGGDRARPDHSMEHLTCFSAGWLALGAQYQTDAGRRRRHMKLAEDIAFTCWQMYAQQPTGIAPERVKQMRMDLTMTDTREYILRPEALEAFWYMHALTGESKYREWGWKIFQKFEQHLKTRHGYASLRDVRNPNGGMLDRMESFWIAETLKCGAAELSQYAITAMAFDRCACALDCIKSVCISIRTHTRRTACRYALMLQDDAASVDLKKYVMNTEAHPFPILDASQNVKLSKLVD
jgi:hypothetical protein